MNVFGHDAGAGQSGGAKGKGSGSGAKAEHVKLLVGRTVLSAGWERCWTDAHQTAIPESCSSEAQTQNLTVGANSFAKKWLR
jgi:hypothetical protein